MGSSSYLCPTWKILMMLMAPHHVCMCLDKERAGQQQGLNKIPSKEESEQLQAAVPVRGDRVYWCVCVWGGQLTRSDMGKRGDLIAQLAKSTGRKQQERLVPPTTTSLSWSCWDPLWPSSPPFPCFLPCCLSWLTTSEQNDQLSPPHEHGSSQQPRKRWALCIR